MRGWALLLLAVVVGVAVLGGVGAVHAQRAIDPVPVVPPYCGSVEVYDHNDDGRLDWRDFELWVVTVHESGEACRLGGPASGCPGWVDVNRDQVVSVADLDAMHRFLIWCVRPPKTTVPQPSL